MRGKEGFFHNVVLAGLLHPLHPIGVDRDTVHRLLWLLLEGLLRLLIGLLIRLRPVRQLLSRPHG